MLNNAGNTSHRGDSGLLRGALLLSGFFYYSDEVIFSDKNKDGTRRLKLWFAQGIFDAPQEQQVALEGFLKQAFGDRIHGMYFIQSFHWSSTWKSLCIKLKN